MRVRAYRQEDLPTLVAIQQAAAEVDQLPMMSKDDFENWLTNDGIDTDSDVFVITDDDESNEWGQSETLVGMEGETIGYTVLQLSRDDAGYHFHCQGAVLPEHRKRGAGRALLICALNRARIWATEFEHEAEQEGLPIFFEALLPAHNESITSLAESGELVAIDKPVGEGMVLYRRVLD